MSSLTGIFHRHTIRALCRLAHISYPIPLQQLIHLIQLLVPHPALQIMCQSQAQCHAKFTGQFPVFQNLKDHIPRFPKLGIQEEIKILVLAALFFVVLTGKEPHRLLCPQNDPCRLNTGQTQ